MSSLKTIDDLIKKNKLLLVTGKGGIGKTLISCLLAKRAEKLGLKVLLVEQSYVEQMGDLMGVSGIGHDAKWKKSIGIANFTAAGNFKDFITKHLMKSSLLDVIASNKIVHSFFTTIPGFSELMLLGRLYYAMNLDPFIRPDLIILDAYSSGHFLSLMTTPDAVLHSGLAGPIMHQTTKVRNWLADQEQCSVIYVAVPENLVVSETVEFLPILSAKSPAKPSAVIMNRCLGSNIEVTNEPLTNATKFLKSRRLGQLDALRKYGKETSGIDAIRHIPMCMIPDIGVVDEPLSDLTVAQLLGGVL